MEIVRIEPFVAYYARLRERTSRVVERIPPEDIDWRPAEGAFSFADILRHLAAIERWVFAENVRGRPSRYPGISATSRTDTTPSSRISIAPTARPPVQDAIRRGRPLIAAMDEGHVTTPLGGHGLSRGIYDDR